MRTYGRVDGKWVVVTGTLDDATDVWVTTLIQTAKLGLGESPFYAQYGIPAQESIMTQVQPDYYVMNLQQQFSQYFASLIISKEDGNEPVYNIYVLTKKGQNLSFRIAE